MGKSLFRAALLLLCPIVTLVSYSFGQSLESLPRIGVGAKISTLGIGIEAATAVTDHSNVRGGVNFFGYDRGFTRDGIDYAANLRLRSVDAHYDWFLGYGFHLSPGILLYYGNRAEGKATVPGGRYFTLGSRSYFSDPLNPVTGTAEIDFSKNKVAPMATFGFGNLLRRTGRRLSITFEGGVVFGSDPKAMLNLTGSACGSPTGPCLNVASNPQIQADIRSEENKVNNGTPPWDMVRNVLKFYPMVSVGMGYRFK